MLTIPQINYIGRPQNPSPTKHHNFPRHAYQFNAIRLLPKNVIRTFQTRKILRLIESGLRTKKEKLVEHLSSRLLGAYEICNSPLESINAHVIATDFAVILQYLVEKVCLPVV